MIFLLFSRKIFSSSSQPIVFPFFSTYNAFTGTAMPSIEKGELYG
nr:MAG TPA: hypothetical protein [Caudoviricetes sp.]